MKGKVASITDGPAYETPLELLQKQNVASITDGPSYETPLEILMKRKVASITDGRPMRPRSNCSRSRTWPPSRTAPPTRPPRSADEAERRLSQLAGVAPCCPGFVRSTTRNQRHERHPRIRPHG